MCELILPCNNTISPKLNHYICIYSNGSCILSLTWTSLVASLMLAQCGEVSYPLLYLHLIYFIQHLWMYRHHKLPPSHITLQESYMSACIFVICRLSGSLIPQTPWSVSNWIS